MEDGKIRSSLNPETRMSKLEHSSSGSQNEAGTIDRGLNIRISGIRATEVTRALIETYKSTSTLQTENRRWLRYKCGSAAS
jgi:hypothetical protein